MDLPAINVLSLCSGVGGLDLGFKLAVRDARTICYVEIEAYGIETIATRCEEKAMDDAPIWTSVKTFDGKPWRGAVDCIIGGYPCQPFSLAGKRGGKEDPRHLWPSIARIIGEVKPSLCFFENVAGHLSLGFDTVRNELEEMGFTVAAGLFSAEEVGAPHRRERLFILAMANAASSRREGTGKESGGYAKRKTAVPQRQRCIDQSRDESNELADAAGAGHKRKRIPKGRGRDREGEADPQRAIEAMGDAERRGLESRNDGEETGAEIFGPGCLGVFPPGPNDTERWREIDSRLEPAVCRVADGMAPYLADRVDSLRACGNGVVPVQAAYAFACLFAAIYHQGRTLTNG